MHSARDLVPLHTLQHTLLYRSLYPHLADFMPDSPDAAALSPHDDEAGTQTPPSPSSSSAPHNEPRSSSSTSSRPSPDAQPGHACQWQDCDKVMSDPETLYNHLCNDHIGRKSTGNLCLTCKWKDCGTTCAKRDHITSHLRVHTPLKPHVCEVCNKPFKRPQDLKKHEKIHTEEHHAQHKHSKAITVADPAFSSRIRSDQAGPVKSEPAKPKSSMGTRIEVPVARAKSSSVSLSEASSDFGVLPTPSPEIQHSPIQYHTAESHDAYRIQPSWEVLRPDGTSASMPIGGGAGAKRSFDTYSVDEFFTDVKKRRVNPSYDPNMAERLSNLVHAQSLSSTTHLHHPSLHHAHSASHGPGFNPRSVSFDIRSPEELAAVNEFLITLGRDITGSVPRQSGAAYESPSSYFDAATLHQMGLGGMPGIPPISQPGSGGGYHGDGGSYSSASSMLNHLHPSYPSRANHPSVPQVQYNMYPSLADIGPSVASGVHYPHRHVSPEGYNVPLTGPGRASSSFFPPTPSHMLSPHSMSSAQLDGGASPHSSHSTRSTPPIATPPHLSESLASFDTLLPSRAPPTIQLAPVDYQTHTRRTIVPLMTAPGAPGKAPEPVEPKWNNSQVRGPPARLTPLGSSSSSSSVASSSSSNSSSSLHSSSNSLYPSLLTSGDAELTLPPLQHKYRSSTPASSPLSRGDTVSPSPTTMSVDDSSSSASTPRLSHSTLSTRSSSRTPSPSPSPITLPPISRIADTDVRLARRVGRITLGEQEVREREMQQVQDWHAKLVLDMLLSANMSYRHKHGTPPPAPASPRRMGLRAAIEERDVEMIAV